VKFFTQAVDALLMFIGTLIFAALVLAPGTLLGQQQSQPPPRQQSEQRDVQQGTGYAYIIRSSLFYNNCTSCHGNPQVERAPDPAVIRQMSPERIYQALTTGSMKQIAKELSLTDEQIREIAEYMSGRKLGTSNLTSASAMSNRCMNKTGLRDPQSSPGWNGWGFDLANTRFEPANVAKLSPGQISRIKLIWAFGVPSASDLYDQPTIVGGRIYLSSDTGTVYSLDAATGCVYWSFQAQTGVRSAMTVGPPKLGSDDQFVFFGDLHGNAYALNALTGEQVWKITIDPHPESRIIASPKLYRNRLYVPVASLEEAESGSVGYSCCTFRGMVVALDTATGRQIWKTYTIPDTPKTIQKNSLGKDYWGPSGAGVWNSPTIDAKRNALYIGTGNGFSDPPTRFSDAVMAMDLDTGQVLWSFQATANDVSSAVCMAALLAHGHPNGNGVVQLPGMAARPPEKCPAQGGPDWDFAASPILATLPNAENILVAGQKSGTVWGLDVDNKGAVVWSQDVARVLPGGGGEIIFGGAADSNNAYFNLRSGGLVALDLATGVEKWYVSFTPPQEKKQSFGPHGASSAVTLIPGAVLSGSLDGMLRAFSPETGGLIWEFNTARQYDSTVNGVPAKGGSIGSGGPIVVDGRLYMTSGYIGVQHGVPGNAFLAFGTGE
jgi:polyvinyl alcohol dehydrogenase (cytochrome)